MIGETAFQLLKLQMVTRALLAAQHVSDKVFISIIFAEIYSKAVCEYSNSEVHLVQ